MKANATATAKKRRIVFLKKSPPSFANTSPSNILRRDKALLKSREENKVKNANHYLYYLISLNMIPLTRILYFSSFLVVQSKGETHPKRHQLVWMRWTDGGTGQIVKRSGIVHEETSDSVLIRYDTTGSRHSPAFPNEYRHPKSELEKGENWIPFEEGDEVGEVYEVGGT